jgi:hypothetical protein
MALRIVFLVILGFPIVDGIFFLESKIDAKEAAFFTEATFASDEIASKRSAEETATAEAVAEAATESEGAANKEEASVQETVSQALRDTKEMPASLKEPHAAVVISVGHNSINSSIAAPSPALPAAPATEHDHALAAQKSAAEAQYHLEQAKAAFKKTKTNVKEAMETGKKIQSTAGNIKELYEPPPTAQMPLKFGKETREDSQRGWLSRVILQIAFGVIYYLLIVRHYPSAIGFTSNEASAKLQNMNEVSATFLGHTSPPNCLLSWCCTGPRAAHTFYSVMNFNYWIGLVLMSCFPCITLWYFNSFTELNEKLGGERRNPFMGCLSAWFCSCCVVAQDAESLDLMMGMKTQLCGVGSK